MSEVTGIAIIVVLLIVYFVLKQLTKTSTGKLYTPPAKRTPQAAVFSLADLRKHNGHGGAKSYIGLNGCVYDVSGQELYAEGNKYHVFVGHDATVALAKMAADGSHLDQSADSVELSDSEKKVLKDWEARFREKYQMVGRVALSKKDE